MDLAGIARRVYRRTGTNSTGWGASGADLVDAINDAHDHYLSIIRTKTGTFRATAWTTTDLSTGTATPKFASDFHELIPLRVEYQYEKDKKAKAALADELAEKLDALKRFYAMRVYQELIVTIAAPGIFTAPSHGLQAGQRVIFLTTGAVPTGLAVDTWYYVVSTNLGDDTFSVSATKSGTAITTSGSQSGTHYYASDQQPRFTINQQDSNE
jgi:hypothetical protein